MAIELEGPKKEYNWKLIAGLITSISVIGLIAYVFLSQPQIFEVIAPIEVQQTIELSKINLNTKNIEEKIKKFRLRAHSGEPTTGQTGRVNPFIEF